MIINGVNVQKIIEPQQLGVWNDKIMTNRKPGQKVWNDK